MGLHGESAPPASRLRLPKGGWHAVTGSILRVSIAEPQKGIPIILTCSIKLSNYRGSVQFRLSTGGDYLDPHNYWLQDKMSGQDKVVVIPPFVKGREYPAKPIGLTYPVPCR